MSDTRATWFCIDIETFGPVPALYDMCSLGAVVVSPGPDGRLTIGDSHYVEIQPQAPNIDENTIPIHGLDPNKLRETGVGRRQACLDLATWVQEQTRPGTEAVFVGHNAPFDWSFVAWTFHAEGLPNPFGYKGVCTKSVAMGALGLHWLDTNKEVLAERLDLPVEDTTQKHRADYDAAYQAQILIKLLELP